VHGFPGYAAGEPLPTVRQILDGEKPANTDPVRVDILPGSRWRYSGGGYTVLQQLLEDVTGTPFPALLRELVLDPLGMKHSTYEQPLPPARARTAATGHRASGEPVKGKWHTYPEMAAAGLWTTPSDLARFAMAIQQAYAGTSNSVLSRAMARQLLTTQIDGWGLGPGVEGEGRSARFSHGGDNRGFKCYLVAYRDTGQGAVVMTNGDNGADLAQEIIRSIARVYGWPDYAPKEKILARVEPERLAEYKGRYNGRFPLLLTREQDRLWMGWDDIDRRYELLPEADDRFFVVENGMEITFSRDADGRVEGLNLHIYGLTLQSKKLP
jgi:CubicO group peptidase (beta-lactamase class C family)